jgi:hypothetical protein
MLMAHLVSLVLVVSLSLSAICFGASGVSDPSGTPRLSVSVSVCVCVLVCVCDANCGLMEQGDHDFLGASVMPIMVWWSRVFGEAGPPSEMTKTKAPTDMSDMPNTCSPCSAAPTQVSSGPSLPLPLSTFALRS